MGKRGRAALIVACLLACDGCAHKQQVDPVRTAIQAAYDRQSAAYVAKNPRAVIAECSPAYTEANGDHIDSRSTVAGTIAGFLMFADKVNATAVVRRIKVDGHIAEVTVDRHFDYLSVPMKKKADTAYVRHHFVSDETNDDIWSDSTGRWLKLKSATLVSHSSFDGKTE